MVQLTARPAGRVVLEALELQHEQGRQAREAQLLVRRYVLAAHLAAPRVVAIEPLRGDKVREGSTHVGRAADVELHVAKWFVPTRRVAAALTSQRRAQLAAEVSVDRTAEAREAVEEHSAQLLHVMLSKRLGAGPSKRCGQRAR